jgi:BT1 family
MAQKLVRSHDESDRMVVQPLLHHHDGLRSAGVESNVPLDQRDNSNVDYLVNVHACDNGEHRSLDSDASTLVKRPYVLYLYYFCHGMQEELPATALYLVLKKSFQMLPADYSFVLCLSWLPWALKPLVGYLSDARPIAGRRRTPYVVIGIVLNQLGSLLLSEYALIRSKQSFLVIMLFNSLARVVSETAVDSLMAEMARCEPDDQIGRLQSTIWTFDAAGTVAGVDHSDYCLWSRARTSCCAPHQCVHCDSTGVCRAVPSPFGSGRATLSSFTCKFRRFRIWNLSRPRRLPLSCRQRQHRAMPSSTFKWTFSSSASPSSAGRPSSKPSPTGSRPVRSRCACDRGTSDPSSELPSS